jgi:hypothetical protein
MVLSGTLSGTPLVSSCHQRVLDGRGYSEYSPDAADDRERQRDDRAETADGRDAQNRLERDRAARGRVCARPRTHTLSHTHTRPHTRAHTQADR